MGHREGDRGWGDNPGGDRLSARTVEIENFVLVIRAGEVIRSVLVKSSVMSLE
jgi:hypothetical protein